MKSFTIRVLAIVALLVELAGCQSGPRWAWWKSDAAPTDTSAVARSAHPTLPSAQTTPPSIAADGTVSTAPPSSANLAATKMAPGAVLPTSPSTISNAPQANYASLTPGGTTSSPPSGQTASTPTMPPTATSASSSAGGPYDPDAYQPSAGLAPTSLASTGDVPSPGADRYGTITPATPSSPASTAQPTAPPSQDRYGLASADRYGSAPSTTPAPSTPAPGSSIPPTTAAVTPQNIPPIPTTPVSPTPVAQVSSSAVTLTSAPGQYRPGGTSSYAVAPATQHIEVATRPVPPASTVPVSPTTTTSAAPTTSAVSAQSVAPQVGSSVPWSPPGTTAPTSVPGARTY